MKFNRQSYLNTRRDAWVEINLDAIEKNILELKKYAKKDAKILAVVKADAYGHGSVMITPTLLASGVYMLGVASIDEAMQLRENKITAPILVLGAAPVWAFDWAAYNDISLSLFLPEHIEACKVTYEKTGIKPKVHVKLDTGMNRIGVSHENAVSLIKEVQKSDFIELKGIFTHFACAEDLEKTKEQIAIWDDVLSKVNTDGLLLHIANTAALITFPEINYNMARAGIGIYGLQPDLIPDFKNPPKLIPAMSLKGRIVNIHGAHANSGVSYSHRYVTDKETTIATVPIGYADGVSRGLSGKICGLLHGKKVRQIGNITMDQMMFDITGVKADEGDVITLLGQDGDESISINEWADILHTINYELICRLKVRLSRVYTR
ncbi:MAG: alanine racemase [Candidatus Gastranaerophilales bacterium]|nr:alanine racemase [Candidatus Gastranaerophilales bacterium]